MLKIISSNANLQRISTLTSLILALILLIQPSLAEASKRASDLSSPSGQLSPKASNLLEQFPISFTENKGQLNDAVEFYTSGSGYSCYFTPGGVTYSLIKDKECYVLKLEFLGANPNVSIAGQKKQEHKINYLVGDRREWKTDISTYSEIIYKDLYPGIDLIYKSAEGKVKYEFIVYPGAKPSDIQISYMGAKSLSLDNQGHLLISTPLGELRDKKPSIYQIVNKKRNIINSGYAINANKAYFKIGAYSKNLPLVIDPGLEWSTFLGGNADDYISDMAVDSLGNIYVVGSTFSSDFPTTAGVYDEDINNTSLYFDSFVTKLNRDGSTLIYSTYIGGSGDDGIDSIALDEYGYAYLAGSTGSNNFPITGNAFDSTKGGNQDAFVSILSPDGSTLWYSTYLGGNIRDDASDIEINPDGSFVVAGRTFSSDFPTTQGSFDPLFNGKLEGFITKFTPDGTNLIYSTYLGGIDEDAVNDIAVDVLGAVHACGQTKSSDYPVTPGAFDVTPTFEDAFISKLSPSGSSLVFSSYLGGTSGDWGYAIDVDSSCCSVIAGMTSSQDFPITPGSFDTVFSDAEIFITKFSSEGASVVYSTFLGGANDDIPSSVCLNGSGQLIVTGETKSSDFPVTSLGSEEMHHGGEDAFVSEIAADGSTLLYSTCLGGSGRDFGNVAALDALGSILVAGHTNSSDFPATSSAYDLTYNSGGYWGYDGFVIKLDSGLTATYNTEPAGPNTPVTTSLGATTITFSQVDTPGNTTAIQTAPPQGPPSGFRFRGNTYDITTTAGYAGQITITFTYDESEVPGNENNIKLFHWTGSGWEDCTTSVDTVNNNVTGQVTSLSPFAVGYPVSSSGPMISTGYNTYQLGMMGLAFLASGLWFMRRKAIA